MDLGIVETIFWLLEFSWDIIWDGIIMQFIRFAFVLLLVGIVAKSFFLSWDHILVEVNSFSASSLSFLRNKISTQMSDISNIKMLLQSEESRSLPVVDSPPLSPPVVDPFRESTSVEDMIKALENLEMPSYDKIAEEPEVPRIQRGIVPQTPSEIKKSKKESDGSNDGSDSGSSYSSDVEEQQEKARKFRTEDHENQNKGHEENEASAKHANKNS